MLEAAIEVSTIFSQLLVCRYVIFRGGATYSMYFRKLFAHNSLPIPSLDFLALAGIIEAHCCQTNELIMALNESSCHRLYFHPYSICSLMVRYALAQRGEPEASSSDILVNLHRVDMFHEAQLNEHFLLNINLKG